MNWLTHKYRALKGEHPYSRLILILGSGRSGTHWIAYILSAHPDISATVEKRAIFRKVTAMAVDPRLKGRLLQPLIARYRWEHARVAPRHYLDKSHPNLWLAVELADAFPSAQFVGIQRTPYATVSSMLLHKGVLRWCQTWEDYPIPNRFLGITEANVDEYRSLSLAGRCAMRWCSHAKRMLELQQELGDRLLVCSYERLIENTADELVRLDDFLQLDSPIPRPEPKAASLDKWRTHLTAEQLADIDRVVEKEGPRPVA